MTSLNLTVGKGIPGKSTFLATLSVFIESESKGSIYINFVSGRGGHVVLRVDKKWIELQFNRCAQVYDQYAVVQKRMAYRLIETLNNKIKDPKNILEIGCGTGFMTRLLYDHYSSAQITTIDIAEKMVQQAQERLGSPSRIIWLHGDVEEMVLETQAYDLIVSNATVHWFSDIRDTLKKLESSLRPGGFMAHTTFGKDTLIELNDVLERIKEKYGLWSVEVESFPSYEYWESLFTSIGFTETNSNSFWQRIEYPDCYSLLKALKGMGKAYRRFSEQPFSFQRSLLDEVILRYERAYRKKEGVYATFHSIQFTGRKPM